MKTNSTGNIIKEIRKLEEYKKELIKELNNRYENETPIAKRYIKEIQKKY